MGAALRRNLRATVDVAIAPTSCLLYDNQVEFVIYDNGGDATSASDEFQTTKFWMDLISCFLRYSIIFLLRSNKPIF